MSPLHCDCILSSINDSSVALVWLGVVLGIIALCCKFIFLDKREPGARILSVTNRYIHWSIYTESCSLALWLYMFVYFNIILYRNIYNWFSYFFFIYTSIMGFVMAILRVLVSVLFGILLLFRLDRNIMMEGFEFADWGQLVIKNFVCVCILCEYIHIMCAFQ